MRVKIALSREQIEQGMRLGERILREKGQGTLTGKRLDQILAEADPKGCGGFAGAPDPGMGRSMGLACEAGELEAALRRKLWDWGASPWIRSVDLDLGTAELLETYEATRWIYGLPPGETAKALGRAAWRSAADPQEFWEEEERLAGDRIRRATPGEGFSGDQDRRSLSAAKALIDAAPEREARLRGERKAQAKALRERAAELIEAKGAAQREEKARAKPSEAALLRGKSLAALVAGSPKDVAAFEALLAASAEVLRDPRALTRARAGRSALEAAIERAALRQAASLLEAGADPWEACAASGGNPVAWALAPLRWAKPAAPEDRERFERELARACMEKARRIWRDGARAKCLEAARSALGRFGPQEPAREICESVCARMESLRLEEAAPESASAVGGRPKGARRGI